MKGIYRFYVDCHKMGELNGIFIATSDEVKNIIGKKIWFGDALGKHSDINGIIEEDEIELITEDRNLVTLFRQYNLETGINPFDYYDNEIFEEKEKLKKTIPLKEKYGYVESISFDDESGWTIEGGEAAYYKDLKEWKENV